MDLAADTSASAYTMNADLGIARGQAEPLSVYNRRVGESNIDSTPATDNPMDKQQTCISLGEIPHGSAEPVVETTAYKNSANLSCLTSFTVTSAQPWHSRQEVRRIRIAGFPRSKEIPANPSESLC